MSCLFMEIYITLEIRSENNVPKERYIGQGWKFHFLQFFPVIFITFLLDLRMMYRQLDGWRYKCNYTVLIYSVFCV